MTDKLFDEWWGTQKDFRPAASRGAAGDAFDFAYELGRKSIMEFELPTYQIEELGEFAILKIDRYTWEKWVRKNTNP